VSAHGQPVASGEFRRALILGGVRSGKSVYAERIAAEAGGPVLYVATATAAADDEEMAERIARHRAQRPAAWRTIEEPIRVASNVAAELAQLDRGVTVLVEDLTLLMSNLMAQDPAQAETRCLAEVARLAALEAHVILVSNEVGMGVVPPYPSGRLFRDGLGRVNQRAAELCKEVYLLVAGLPLRVK
jgi:adenosylcobinamide kinase / adenosylcobinamide-phosphate guanylyltransferase